MTARTCPFCHRTEKHYSAQHASLCPENPDMRDAYRAALEDPAAPGLLRKCREYDENRKELYSGSFLMRLYGVGWVGLAAHFGLTHSQGRRRPINWIDKSVDRIGAEMDAEIERYRDITDVRQVGLPVLRFEDRQIGNVWQRVYTIR